MSNKYGENPYTRSRQNSGRSSYSGSPYGRGGRGRRRFRVNGFNIALIAVILIAGTVIAISLSSKGNPNGASNGKPSAALSATVSPSPKTTVKSSGAASPGSNASGSSTPSPAPSGSPAASSAADGSNVFTSGDMQVDMAGMAYKSADLSVKVTNVNENGVNYYIADCRAKDSSRLFRAMATGQYPVQQEEKTSAMAREHGAVIAINGDYFGSADSGSSETLHRNGKGIVIINSKLYRSTPWYDIAAIFKDGTMKTFDKSQITADQLISDGAMQAFNFGPMLLDSNGKALPTDQIKKRPPYYNPANPRTGIGYIEPNHFVLVVVDGIRNGYGTSKGMTTSEFAKVFEGLGCKTAYNLDGGGSSVMVFMGKVISHPCNSSTGDERAVSDIVYFGESETDQANIDRMNNQ